MRIPSSLPNYEAVDTAEQAAIDASAAAHLAAYEHESLSAVAEVTRTTARLNVVSAKMFNANGIVQAMPDGHLSRRTFTIDRACSGIRLEFGSQQADAGAASSYDSGAYHIGAVSVELTNGTILPVYFSGARQADVAFNEMLYSDELVHSFAAGETIYIRTAIKTTPVEVSGITAAAPGVVTCANHGLIPGSIIAFVSSDTLPAGLSAGTKYFVRTSGWSTSQFSVSTSSAGGSGVTTTDTGTGTHYFYQYAPGRYSYETTGAAKACTRSSNTFSSASHGFLVGDVVTPDATACGVTAGVGYYVISTSFDANTFSVSLTPDGTIVTLTAGSVNMTRYADRQMTSWATAGFDEDTDTTAIDSTAVSAAPWTSSSANAYSCCPTAILGTLVTRDMPNVLVIGDSIMSNGINVSTNWLTPSLVARNIPFMICARPAESTTTAANNVRLQALLQYADIVISAIGVNDQTTSTSVMKQRMRDWWALFPGKEVYQITLPPRTKSDGTDADFDATITTTFISTMNAWLRTCPAPVAGIIDMADLTHTYRDSNRWRRGYQTDGGHPNLTKTGLTVALPPTDAINAELECNPDKYLPFVKGVRSHMRPVLTPIMNATVYVPIGVGVDNTYVQTSHIIPIPRGILRDIIIEVDTPGATSGLVGSPTVSYSVGSVATADNDLADATDIDILTATADQTAASSKHGLEAAYVDKYYAAVDVANVVFNFLGKVTSGGAANKYVWARVKIWVVSDPLP